MTSLYGSNLRHLTAPVVQAASGKLQNKPDSCGGSFDEDDTCIAG